MFFKGNACSEKNIFHYSRKAMSVFVTINPSVLHKLMMHYFLDVTNFRALFIVPKDQKTINLFLNMFTFKGRCLLKFILLCRSFLLKQNPERTVL